MKMRINTMWLAVFALAVTLGAGTVTAEVAASIVEVTDIVGATGTIGEDLLASPLADNFDDGGYSNLWGGQMGSFSEANPPAADSFCTIAFTDDAGDVLGNSGYSLKIDYNITRGDTFAGYFTKLENANLSAYNYLSFWVKGEAGGEYFKIELHHGSYDPAEAVGFNDDYKAQLYIADYLDGGVTTGWQKVTIPLDAFANIYDWSDIDEFVIAFENSQSAENSSPLSGTVYVDNISFGHQFLGFVRIDHYGDRVSVNALGGNSSHTSGGVPIYGSYEYTDVAGQYRDHKNGLGFHFDNVVDPRYYVYYSIIGGGDDGFIKQPRDFSAYNRVSFWIRSSASNVNCIKMELHCPTNTNNYFHFFKNNITNSWQKFSLPLTDFTTSGFPGNGASIISSGKIAQLGEITFTRDGWWTQWAAWDQGVATGSFYIDNVQLEKTGYTPDTTAPAAPSGPNVAGSGVLSIACFARSRTQDPSIENVRFDYNDGEWKTIKYDYDTSNSGYQVTWDVTGLAPGSYQLRAVAMDAAGNETSSITVPYMKP